MRKALVSLLAIQIFVILAVAAGFYVYDREPAAVAAALYGGGVAVGASLLLAWRMSRAGRSRAALNLGGLVLGLLERIVFIVAALIVGFAVLRLVPLALIAGFVGGELAHYLAAGPLRRHVLKQSEGGSGG